MEKKKTVLVRTSYLIDLPDDEINSDNGMLDKITNAIDDLNLQIDNNNNILLEWNSTSCLTLEPEIYNCGKCANCGKWATDRQKADSIEGLSNGATIDGKLLCDECLPSDHRWAF